ncbi:uncharacterized protein LOC113564840 [Drosophila erecta]|uniref:uncharacterized protein LOC113564840 n=1 Tax=Drosophila erecta TaxID=7220 RepID=UPI000F067EB0|nr:uncharacterized protein LOC113564840 [Drosophila erecta]
MAWLKYLICLLVVIQWTTARPVFPGAEEHVDTILEHIRCIIHAGISILEGMQKSNVAYESQTRGPPRIAGVSKYDIIDLHANRKG